VIAKIKLSRRTFCVELRECEWAWTACPPCSQCASVVFQHRTAPRAIWGVTWSMRHRCSRKTEAVHASVPTVTIHTKLQKENPKPH